MPVDFVSLAAIALVAAVCPLIAQAIPGKPIPETVFLLLAGALLGPHLLSVVHLTESVGLLSDLGLAFLFLLAGYDISPKNLTSNQGKRGLVTWVVSLALAFLAVRLSPDLSISHIDGIAIAIALTTTALGTLMPILKERQLMGTRVGNSILAYGTWGELCPVLAMALLLSTRAEWKTMLILLAFVAVAVLVAVLPAKAKKAGHKVFSFITANANTTSQTMMRVTVLLLVGLVTLSAVFNLDIVLGAFAAGFVLRYVIPAGNEVLEHKLEGVAYGFLIPIFFVASGAKIDLTAVFAQPVLLVGFIIMLLLIRAVPVFAALSTGRDTRDMSSHNRLSVALYCTTALPIIVAVTSVAVTSGAMSQETASVLVAAGAITVFLMPLLGSITYHVADAQPIEAVREIRQRPRDIGSIIRDHMTLERMLAREKALTASWQDRAAALQEQSMRSRALEEARDAAQQELAARNEASEDAAASLSEQDLLAQRREARRKRLAALAAREQQRRLRETARLATSADGTKKGDAKREDARRDNES
ncbi:cation:proton antiporter [Gordonibacter sp.]|uniref:cation:proton antiporter n=1 Tax=Gordonibacter sp. TaxID=1968902 RepID=UPI002FCC8D2D